MIKYRSQTLRQSGFTIIELLAVMMVISIMAAPFAYQHIQKFEEDRIAITVAEINDLFQSAQNYAAEQDSEWPSESDNCVSAINTLNNESYLQSFSTRSPFGTNLATSCTTGDGKRFIVSIDAVTAGNAEILNGYLPSSTVSGNLVSVSVPMPASIPALEHLLPRDGSRSMTGNLDMGGNDINNLKNLNATGEIRGASFVDNEDPNYKWDGSGESRMNYADMNYARLRNSYTEGTACTSKQVGTTNTGELMSCVSGVWKKSAGVNVGGKQNIAFNTEYCLGRAVYVYAEIRGNVRDLMGVQIVVNGSADARARADSEGWEGYESVNTILGESDCFRISHLTSSTSARRAWYRFL
ncbi:MAG: hypothetical protein CMH23_02680 [Methylophaga sp.]|jgi:prepilin-type N-terminal cleavage/methylation domain-containing protein|uniref:type II secretion system protein n=1 Tax=Methylophaga sp. TaxID=2024840 RepID=UPI000C92C620|nr:type II secretion system protein [Methylophaga sp.]MBN45358.1 hypothetical protein [Methylophaga sp.]|tara:strand:- start:64502 stop:65563 length:1062 start_codon:yes stop_codon:yes gene_type:complete